MQKNNNFKDKCKIITKRLQMNKFKTMARQSFSIKPIFSINISKNLKKIVEINVWFEL